MKMIWNTKRNQNKNRNKGNRTANSNINNMIQPKKGKQLKLTKSIVIKI